MIRRLNEFVMPTYEFVERLKNDPRFESNSKFRAVAKLLASLDLLGECGFYHVLRDISNDAIVRAIQDFESTGWAPEWANGLEAYDGLDKFWAFVTKLSETRLNPTNCFEPWLIDQHMSEALSDEIKKPKKSWRYHFIVSCVETHGHGNSTIVLDIHIFVAELLSFVFHTFIKASIMEGSIEEGEYFTL